MLVTFNTLYKMTFYVFIWQGFSQLFTTVASNGRLEYLYHCSVKITCNRIVTNLDKEKAYYSGRDGPRTPSTLEMEPSVTIAKGWRPLIIVAKSPILHLLLFVGPPDSCKLIIHQSTFPILDMPNQ